MDGKIICFGGGVIAKSWMAESFVFWGSDSRIMDGKIIWGGGEDAG
jgi:hypothetical protein